MTNANQNGEPAGLSVEQEPNYTTNGSHLINRHNGEQIPAGEPTTYDVQFTDVSQFGLGVGAFAQRLLDDIKSLGRDPQDLCAEAVSTQTLSDEETLQAQFKQWADAKFGPAPVGGYPQHERFKSYYDCVAEILSMRG